MIAFQICMVGIVATGGALVILSPFRNLVVYGVIICLCLSYFFFFCIRKKDLSLNSAEKGLLCFVGIGLLYIIFSYLGVNQLFKDQDLYYDKSFIPRQAVYFLALPTIVLFQDDYFTKGKEYLISHYGELLFWILFIFEFFYFGRMITVATNLILCWLALRIKSFQTWRNWLRYIAVLVAPMTIDGTSTMYILRFLFLVIIIIPQMRNRVLLKWVAIAVLLVIIVSSFVAPLVITDSSFISDGNAKWRLNYWTDEMHNLEKTYGLGVGYGTSYPSKTFAATTYFTATDQYSIIERMFVLACHNSFVAVAMRTGFFGISCFLLFIALMLWNMLKYPVLASKASFFALFGAVVLIAFNVGLESPSYLFCFVFCLGECNQEVKRIRKASQKLDTACGEET